ncbi:MAG: M14 family metallopeptidase [Chloroflexota bacterium]|nr:M14 family metallopeptidase [Chloroflexota bacterium]
MRLTHRFVVWLAALCWMCGSRIHAQAIPAPRAVLGFEVGADRTLADWRQIVSYFGALAASSPAVELDTLGATTLGRPFVLATISAPENIRKIEAIRSAQAKLADPRRLSAEEEARLVASQPAVLLVSCNIHATEIASSQMAMELAYRLATNDTLQRALRNVVVLLIPSMNPDGEQIVTEWYRGGVGTRWEGGPLPWLYHHYVGHDNNRDWFMITQRETRLVTDLMYRRWFPEVFYDVHQMGNEGARIFVPPFVDPINPNVDPLIVRQIAHIGAEMALALEERGKRGVADGVIYDLWWHGGARSTPTRHNMAGVLTEAASVKIATPITQDSTDLKGHARGLPRYERRMNFPNPWPGGVWRLRDIVEYELIAAEALVKLASQQREQYVQDFVALGRKAVHLGETEAPYAYVVPSGQRDPGAVDRLIETLRAGGVEVEQAAEDFVAGGRTFRRGSHIVPMAQPYRAHAKDLLEVQHFPKMEQWPGGPVERPYDVAGWTLPLQMGVEVVPMDSLLPPVRIGRPPNTCRDNHRRTAPVVLDARDTRSYLQVVRALRAGGAAPIRRATTPVRVQGGEPFPAGTWLLETVPRGGIAPLAPAGSCPVLVSALPRRATVVRLPRLALYKPWTANMDEGWTRWLLEQFDFPYTALVDSTVKAGALRDQFDVVLVPDMSLREMREGMSVADVPPRYAGGLGTAGLEALKQFVNAGGTLVLLDRASELATTTLGVPVQRITVPPRSDDDDEFTRGVDSTRNGSETLFAPGSIFRVLVDRTHPVAYGMPDTAAVYFTNSVTFDVASGSSTRVIARYPTRADDILLSGYLQGGQAIAGKAAAIEATVGRGRVVMFGFRPQYRGQSYGTFKMLFNALLLSGAAGSRR